MLQWREKTVGGARIPEGVKRRMVSFVIKISFSEGQLRGKIMFLGGSIFTASRA